MAAQQIVDWERIEADYRVGTRSLREIATEHKITEGAVRKRAKRDAWERNLKAKVQARSDALVRKELVRTEVRKENVTEKQAIEVEATVSSRIRLSHQSSAARMQKMVTKLASELERQTERKVALKDRASTAKSLIDAFGRLVAIEREAHGINSAPIELNDPFTAMLTSLQGTARTIVPVPDIQDVEAK